MNDNAEVIRRQMEETKSQLADKLESLESHVSKAVHSTSTVVSAAAQSVSNAFDVRRHVDRHPWMVLGGAALLGYLAVDFLTGRVKKSQQLQQTAASPSPPANNAGQGIAESDAQSAATTAAIAAAYESGRKSASRLQLQDVAIRALVDIVEEVAILALPKVVDYLTGNPTGDRTSHAEDTEEIPYSQKRRESSAATPHRQLASSDQTQRRNSF